MERIDLGNHRRAVGRGWLLPGGAAFPAVCRATPAVVGIKRTAGRERQNQNDEKPGQVRWICHALAQDAGAAPGQESTQTICRNILFYKYLRLITKVSEVSRRGEKPTLFLAR
jgi:hypothetical protein